MVHLITSVFCVSGYPSSIGKLGDRLFTAKIYTISQKTGRRLWNLIFSHQIKRSLTFTGGWFKFRFNLEWMSLNHMSWMWDYLHVKHCISPLYLWPSDSFLGLNRLRRFFHPTFSPAWSSDHRCCNIRTTVSFTEVQLLALWFPQKDDRRSGKHPYMV